MRLAATRYLFAVGEAARIYRRVCELRGKDDFIAEVAFDQTETPQSPAEHAVILSALVDEGVPVQTIAPKFSGRFNKGVDHVGDIRAFFMEFEVDVRVATWASTAFGLPASLKLPVQSGSDEFCLYEGIGEIVRREDAGLHLKTVGTTWLEEIVGLAESGGDGLAMAREAYRAAYDSIDEVMAPYPSVMDIDRARLPSPSDVDKWESGDLVAALWHGRSDSPFLDALGRHEESASRNVTMNLWERHLRSLVVV